jgi:8-oxo-dGTP pyrophosphatase MutT (NUDIX family)
MPDVYRSCASIAVFRPTNVCSPDGCGQVYEILLLHKPRKNDSWQLPQGGCEQGEDITQAAVRELQEEASLTVDVFGKSAHVYQYDFPSSYRRFRPDHVRGQRIEFILALLQGEQQVQVDGKEIDGFQWILPEQLPQFLRRKAYLEVAQAVVKDGLTHLAA